MVNYLDWKDKSGLDYLGEAGIAQRSLIVSNKNGKLEQKIFLRKSVHLPSGLEMSSEDVISLDSGSPDLVAFLSKYLAKQLKETHQRSIHIQCEAARNSTKALSIPIQKRTSEMIRYI